MPIFAKKFSFKTLPVRLGRLPETLFAKIDDELDNFEKLTLNLGLDRKLSFNEAIWSQMPSGKQDEYSRIKRKNKQLENENQLLNIKIEIALDMLAEVHSELGELKNPQESEC